VSKLAANAELASVVAAKLDDDWSPQQIAQWLRREHSGAAAMRVSYESIYRDVYMPSRKVFDASMFHRLRSDRSIRRPLGKRSSYGRGQIRNTVSIRERPVEADTREVAGHWEVISCSERVRQRWQPWWIAPPVTRWSSRCPTGARPTRSPAH
jgi:IS30 family transposase